MRTDGFLKATVRKPSWVLSGSIIRFFMNFFDKSHQMLYPDTWAPISDKLVRITVDQPKIPNILANARVETRFELCVSDAVRDIVWRLIHNPE